MGAGPPSSRASGVGSRVWSLRLQQVGFPSPQVTVEERGKASSGSRSILRVLVVVMVRLETFLLQLGVCRIKGAGGAGDPDRSAYWVAFLFGLLGGCAGGGTGGCQGQDEASSAAAAEHTVFVLKDKWDRAEAHRKGLQETAEKKQREYEAAAQRASDQAAVADDLKKAYRKARKELDKTAASCASASVGERECVSSDDGLANAGLDDEEMEQVFPECMLDTPEAPPANWGQVQVQAPASPPRLVISRFGPLPVRIRLLVVMLGLGLSVWVLLLLYPPLLLLGSWSS